MHRIFILFASNFLIKRDHFNGGILMKRGHFNCGKWIARTCSAGVNLTTWLNAVFTGNGLSSDFNFSTLESCFKNYGKCVMLRTVPFGTRFSFAPMLFFYGQKRKGSVFGGKGDKEMVMFGTNVNLTLHNWCLSKNQFAVLPHKKWTNKQQKSEMWRRDFSG